MARRRRHNQGGGRQPAQKMFDLRREELFRYDATPILQRAPMDEAHHRAFLQQVVTQGARNGIVEAKEFIRQKADEEGLIDPRGRDMLIQLLDRYAKYR